MHLYNLPKENRPREKALKYGINSLSDQELIAILIGSGYKGFNVLDIANELLLKVHGLGNLINFSDEDLMSIKGIKKAKAIRFLASIELVKRIKINSTKSEFYLDYIQKFKSILYSEKQEHLYIIGLDNKMCFKKEYLVSKSGRDIIIVFIKEILRLAIKLSTKYVCLIHNHPSGDFIASEDDLKSTKIVKVELAKFGIILVDHFIVSDDKIYSILKEKII